MKSKRKQKQLLKGREAPHACRGEQNNQNGATGLVEAACLEVGYSKFEASTWLEIHLKCGLSSLSLAPALLAFSGAGGSVFPFPSGKAATFRPPLIGGCVSAPCILTLCSALWSRRRYQRLQLLGQLCTSRHVACISSDRGSRRNW